jgi:hypothetical protein
MKPTRTVAAWLLAVAPAIALAASPFDGFWMIVQADKSLDPGSQVEFRVDHDHVTMNTPMGASYSAKLDGSDAPVAGDANTTSVSVRMPNKRTLVETARNGGKPWLVTTMEIEPGGRTAKVTWKNLKTNASGSYVMSKQ